MTIMLHQGILIGMQHDGHHMHRAVYARTAESLGLKYSPVKDTETEASWQEGNVMMSVVWGPPTPAITMLDT